MNRICITIALILCFFWACNREVLEIQKPLTSGIHPSTHIEYIHDSTQKDLEARIKLSEAQIQLLKKHSVKGPKSLQIMSASEPVHYKADNPPE
jgi:hypothetical protein